MYEYLKIKKCGCGSCKTRRDPLDSEFWNIILASYSPAELNRLKWI